VVAFIVTVKLVENRVKRKVGNVMVVNVMIQKRIPGMTLIRKMIIRPKLKAQDLWIFICSMVVRLARATAEGIAEAMVLGTLVKVSISEETVPERDMTECWIFSA
jgi:hypothetical protein